MVNVPGFLGVKLMDFPVTALENPCHCTISLGRRSGNIILSTVAVIGLPTLGVPLTVKLTTSFSFTSKCQSSSSFFAFFPVALATMLYASTTCFPGVTRTPGMVILFPFPMSTPSRFHLMSAASPGVSPKGEFSSPNLYFILETLKDIEVPGLTTSAP